MFFAARFMTFRSRCSPPIVLIAASHLVRIEDLKRCAWLRVPSSHLAVALCRRAVARLLDGLLLAAVGSLVMLIAHTCPAAVVVLGREPARGAICDRARCPDAGAPGRVGVGGAGDGSISMPSTSADASWISLTRPLRASRQSSSTFRWCPQSTPPREAHCARWHARSGPAASQSSLPNCAMRSWTT